MTEGEVEFVRPHMRQAGVPDSLFENLVRQWAETGTPSFIQHLANSGFMPVADARQLTLVFKGYVSLEVKKLFSRLKQDAVRTNSHEPVMAESETVSAEALTETPMQSLVETEEHVSASPEPAESMSLTAFLSSQAPESAPATAAHALEPAPSAPITPPPPAQAPEPAFATNPLAGAFGASPTAVEPSPPVAPAATDSTPTRSSSVSSSLSSLGGVWSGGTVSSHESPVGASGPARAEVGSTLGRYTLQEMLGEGSTSRIFRAFHETLGVPVAIKVYRPTSRINSAELESKFVNEARMLARLDHPNIVRVLDVDVADHLPYIVFEYVGAMTLEELVAATGKLPADRVTKVGIQVADALACAAEQAVLHRDVKPANVLLKKDGTAKLADFGLATMGEEDGAASICGSPAYMAPEQVLDPAGVDHRADMYGLGATLYHAATGQPPFVRASPKETLRAQIHELPAPIHESHPTFDEALSKLILQLLEKKADARFYVWSEVAAALRQCMSIVTEGTARDLPQRDSIRSTGRLKRVMSSILGRTEGN